MYNLNNLYSPIREKIFSLLASKSISQRDFAQAIDVIPQTVTDWKNGKSFSFMKKLTPIAEALGTSEAWLLTEKNTVLAPGVIEEVNYMNAKFEIDPTLLDSAVEIMKDAQAYYIADACALSNLGGPEAKELAQKRLQAAKTAQALLDVFAQQ